MRFIRPFIPHRAGSPLLVLIALLLAVPALVACDGEGTDEDAPSDVTTPAASPTAAGSAATPDDASPAAGTGEVEEITIGLTFVPNIQFAPFYVAIEKGYYEDAGLEVTLNHHQAGADQFGALVAGQED